MNRFSTSLALVFSITLAVGNLSAQSPQIFNGGAVNGASFTTPLTAGSIMSVFGSNLASATTVATSVPLATNLGGTQLLVNNIPAPLFFVSSGQINAQVPWQVAGSSTLSLQVVSNGVASNTISVQNASFAPALFSLPFGQGAILISGTNSLAAPAGTFDGARPVSAGETIAIFAEGLGAVSNQPATGAAAGSNPLSIAATTPTVTIGGVPATVTFAGLAPGAVGEYQINAQIGANTPGGNAVPVVVSVGGSSSNSVTIAVNAPPPPALADVTVTKIESPNPVASGGSMIYIVTAQNLGAVAAQNVTVTDTLPVNVSFGSCSITVGTCSATLNTVTANIGTLASGASAVLVISATAPTVTSVTTITNSASISTSSTESNTNNNNASQSTQVNAAAATGAADLTIQMLAVPSSVTSLESLAFVITVQNAGGAAAQDVKVTENLPGGINSASCSAPIGSCTISGIALTASLGTLAAGSSAVVLITGTAADVSSTTPISNTAAVSTSSAESNTGNNSASAQLSINPTPSTGVPGGTVGGGTTGAGLAVSVTAAPNPVFPGASVTFTVTVQNQGTVQADSVSATVTALPTNTTTSPATTVMNPTCAGVCSVVGSQVTAGLGSLIGGGISSFSFTATAPALNTTTPSILLTGSATANTATAGVTPASVTTSITLTVSISGTSGTTIVTAAPGSANVKAIVVDPGTPANVYAATNGGGVFRSVNGGGIWAPINSPGLTNTFVQAMALDTSANPATTMYIGTTAGVFKSTNVNSGAPPTWTAMNFGLSSLDIRAIIVTSATTAFVATNGGGVFKTTNGGTSWAQFNSTSLTNKAILSMVMDTPGNLYVGTNGGGIFKNTLTASANWVAYNNASSSVTTGIDMSTAVVQALIFDAGTTSLFAGTSAGVFKTPTTAPPTWDNFNSAGLTKTAVLSLATDAVGSIYAGTNGGGVFKSSTAVANWSAGNSGLTDLFVTALTVHPTIATTVLAGTSGTGIFLSTNGGQTWTANLSAMTTGLIRAVAVDPTSAAVIYVGTDGGGVFKSTDTGATWAPVNTGLVSLSVRALAINPGTPTTVYAGTAAGVFKTTTGGSSWFPANSGLTTVDVTSLAFDLAGSVYAGTSGGVFQSTNGGSTWSAFNGGTLASTAITSLALDSSSNIYAGTNGGGVCKTATSAASWVCSNTGLTNTAVNALAIDLNTAPNTIYAGTNDGLFKSTDGANWTQLFSGTAVGAVAVNPAGTAGGTVYVVTTLGTFKSTDSGATWAPSGSGLNASNVQAIATVPGSTTTFYAGTTAGLFTTGNSGATWTAVPGTTFTPAAAPTQLGGGPPGGDVRSLAITGTTVFAGARGGVFKSVNSGGTWAAFNTGLTDVNVRSVAMDGIGNVYAATSTGVFRSATAAAAWLPVNFGLSNTDVLSLVVTGGSIFAATNGGGVFKSTAGAGVPSWTAFTASSFPTPTVATSLIADASGNIYAATASGVNKSSAATANWAVLTGGSATGAVQALAVDATNVYAGTPTGVFKTAAGSISWALFDSAGLTDKNVTALAVDPAGFLYAGTIGGTATAPGTLFKSPTGGAGAAWAAATGVTINASVLTLMIDPGSAATYYAGMQGGGVLKNTTSVGAAAGAWAASNSGLGAGNAVALVADPTVGTGATAYAGLFGGGIFKTTNKGVSWTAATTQPTDLFVQALAMASSTTLYAGTKSGVFKSTDSGVTWVGFGTAAAPAGLTSLNVLSLVVDGSGNVYAGTSGGVFKTAGATAAWAPFNFGLASPITTLALSGTGPSGTPTIFAGTTSNGVFQSPQSAAGWAVFGGVTSPVLSLSIDATGGIIYAATNGGGVFKSTNLISANWTAVNFGLTNLVAQAIAAQGGGSNTVYVGTQAGIFKSTDGGSNWNVTASGLSLLVPDIRSLAIAAASTADVYAGSSNGGVFESPNSGATWTATTP